MDGPPVGKLEVLDVTASSSLTPKVFESPLYALYLSKDEFKNYI